MKSHINTGLEEFDRFLGGGFEKEVISTIYGPGGSGKTNICILMMVNVVKQGKKVIYIDTESSFSLSRMMQVDKDYEKTLKNVLFLKPVSFEEQKEAFEKLKDIVNDEIGLIIVDSIAMLYRLEFGKSQDIYEVNRELGAQISYLSEIGRKKKIPILITNQVYSSFDDREEVKLVGGDILRYGSKCLLEIKKGKNNVRIAIIRKHRSLPEGKEFMFQIIEEGIKTFNE
jgi:DNA repair protein RadB